MSSAADNDGPSAAPSAADEYNPDYIDEGEDGNMIDPMYSSSQNFQHMWVLRRVFWVWSYFSAGWTHCLTFEKKPGNQICNCAMRHAGIHSFKVALKNGLLAILHYNTAVSYVSGGAVCLSCAHLASPCALDPTLEIRLAHLVLVVQFCITQQDNEQSHDVPLAMHKKEKWIETALLDSNQFNPSINSRT